MKADALTLPFAECLHRTAARIAKLGRPLLPGPSLVSLVEHAPGGEVLELLALGFDVPRERTAAFRLLRLVIFGERAIKRLEHRPLHRHHRLVVDVRRLPQLGDSGQRASRNGLSLGALGQFGDRVYVDVEDVPEEPAHWTVRRYIVAAVS